MNADNYVVNVDLEGLRAHLMGLETSDEGSVTEGNDDDATRAEDEVREGDPEDEDSLRGALRGIVLYNILKCVSNLFITRCCLLLAMQL